LGLTQSTRPGKEAHIEEVRQYASVALEALAEVAAFEAGRSRK
jgi:hypothetical protein